MKLNIHDITKEQDNYIKQYLNQFEKSTYNGDFKYIDLPSFYRYFIVQEFCGDIDSMLSSFHCHKKKEIKNYILVPFGIMIFRLITMLD